MADDRLDDAIDAVVRAVDRIERATRGQRRVEDVEHSVIDDAEIARELRPPATGVAPGRGAWDPDPQAPAVHVRKKDKHKKKKHRAEEPTAPLATAAAPFLQPTPPEDSAPAASPAPDAPAFSPEPEAGSSAPAEVHELVGRIVARTQELDDHLEASRRLRSEINELVARLAAATTTSR